MSKVLLAILVVALVFTPLDMTDSKRIAQAQGKPPAGGRVLWQDFLDLGGTDRARRVVVRNLAFVVGDGATAGNRDWLVRAYNTRSGQFQWMDRFDGGNVAIAFEVAADDRAIYVAGTAASPLPGANCFLTPMGSNCDFAVRAYTHSGTLLWHHQSDMNGLDDFFFSIDVDGGRVVASGGTINPFGNEDAIVRAFDAATGAVLWTRVLDGGSDDEASDVDVDGGQVFVSGIATQPGGTCTIFTEPLYSGQCDYAVGALDAATGIILWGNQFDLGSDFDAAGEVVVQGQRVFVTGTGTPPGSHCETDFGGTGGNCDILVRAFDRSTGSVLWTRQIGEPEGFDTSFHITADAARAYISGLTVHPGLPGPTCFKPFSTFPPQKENCDWLVAALDAASGNVVWQDRLDVNGGLDVAGDTIVEGKQVVTVGRGQQGTAVDAHQGQDAIVRVYDAATGRLGWEHRFDRAGHHDRWRGLAVAGQRVIAVGESTGPSGTRDFAVMAFSR